MNIEKRLNDLSSRRSDENDYWTSLKIEAEQDKRKLKGRLFHFGRYLIVSISILLIIILVMFLIKFFQK